MTMPPSYDSMGPILSSFTLGLNSTSLTTTWLSSAPLVTQQGDTEEKKGTGGECYDSAFFLSH